jgi:hypothetical protein
MAILTPTDFASGRYKIPLNPKQLVGDMPDYIDRVEAYYLPRLFGKVLFDLFEADLALPIVGDPTAPRFVYVFNPFTNQDDDNYFLQSLGIKDMLKGFVYYEYGRDHVTRLTTTGIKLTEGANSSNVSGIHHDLNSRYNESIQTYKVIQFYMDVTEDQDYPEFEGIIERFNHTF